MDNYSKLNRVNSYTADSFRHFLVGITGEPNMKLIEENSPQWWFAKIRQNLADLKKKEEQEKRRRTEIILNRRYERAMVSIK